MDKSLRRDSLETKAKKLNKNRLRDLLASQIIEMGETGKGQEKVTFIRGRNFAGNIVEIRNRKEADALADLATLNGYTVE